MKLEIKKDFKEESVKISLEQTHDGVLICSDKGGITCQILKLKDDGGLYLFKKIYEPHGFKTDKNGVIKIDKIK